MYYEVLDRESLGNAAVAERQEPVAYQSRQYPDKIYPAAQCDEGFKQVSIPLYRHPAPQEPGGSTERELTHSACPQGQSASMPSVGAAPTRAQALEALDSMDDFARMGNIDPIGPRKVLDDYINGATPSPDEVAEMVRVLRDYSAEDVPDMLEQQQRRIAELEAQREGMVLVPNDPTGEIIDAMREQITEYGYTCNTDGYWAMYKAALTAATKEK